MLQIPVRTNDQSHSYQFVIVKAELVILLQMTVYNRLNSLIVVIYENCALHYCGAVMVRALLSIQYITTNVCGPLFCSCV